MSNWMEYEHFASQNTEAVGRQAPSPSKYPEDPSKSLSYWIREHPINLDTISAQEVLPKEADVVIIGSGITGAAALYEISEKQPNLRVALLEARGLCSGATGRNGGHIGRPEAQNFRKVVDQWGLEEALRLRNIGTKNRNMMIDCVQKLNGVCETSLRVNGTMVVFGDKEERDEFETDLNYAKEIGLQPEGYMISPEQVIQKADIEPTVARYGAAFLARSGTIFPRKFVHLLFKTARERMPFLTIHPYTPATSIAHDSSATQYPYTVNSPKGSIKCRSVFHATNAYVSHLVPELVGNDGVFGCKAHMLGVNPNTGNKEILDLGFGYNDFWHWIQQRPESGTFLYGLADAEELGGYDDTITLPSDHPIHQTMCTFLESTFTKWFKKIDPQKDIIYDWTGIQGFTKDGASIVGRPNVDRPGEFVSVGHNGEGMGRCFACATVAVEALLSYLQKDDSWSPPEWFPNSYRRNI